MTKVYFLCIFLDKQLFLDLNWQLSAYYEGQTGPICKSVCIKTLTILFVGQMITFLIFIRRVTLTYRIEIYVYYLTRIPFPAYQAITDSHLRQRTNYVKFLHRMRTLFSHGSGQALVLVQSNLWLKMSFAVNQRRILQIVQTMVGCKLKLGKIILLLLRICNTR